jgi:hypothetical protein
VQACRFARTDIESSPRQHRRYHRALRFFALSARTSLPGISLEAFIISQNLARRHMTPGQRAMVVAVMYPESGKRTGRGNKVVGADDFPMVSNTSLRSARKVLRLAKDQVGNVLNGTTWV